MIQFVKEANDISKINRRRVYGVGINDAGYQTHIYEDGRQVQCPYYKAWVNILRKCYQKHTSSRYVVAKEWYQFTNFRFWMEQQSWENKQLSIEALSPWNKVYSPDTCVFVYPEIITLFRYQWVKSGEYPSGVCFHQNKFRARGRVEGRIVELGYYDTPEEASKAYRGFRADLMRSIAYEQTNDKITQGLLWHADLIRYSVN